MIIRTATKKTGVVVKNRMEAKSIIDALAHLKQPILIEEVSKNIISAYVADPGVITTIKKRSKQTDILFAPGQLRNHRIKIDEEQLAVDTARSMDTHFARVDIAINGEPKVANVELRPGLIAPSRATGVNIPRKIVETVYDNYTTHKERPMLLKFFDDAKSVVRDVLRSKQF